MLRGVDGSKGFKHFDISPQVSIARVWRFGASILHSGWNRYSEKKVESAYRESSKPSTCRILS